MRLLSNERSKAVKFVIGKDQVEITSSTPEVGEAHEVLPVDYGGDAMQICFNADYVDNFLRRGRRPKPCSSSSRTR